MAIGSLRVSSVQGALPDVALVRTVGRATVPASSGASMLVRNAGHALRRLSFSSWWSVTGLAILVAFAFLGSRGLWEPDEGRYVQVAREMTISGDYLVPTLNTVPHFTKPPLTYWLVAAGLRVIGMNEWGARIGNGIAFAATALLVALLGERLAASPSGRWAGMIYVTMLLPFVAGSLVTPDTLVTLCHTGALFCFWNGWTAPAATSARRWMVGFWASLGAGFLAKGPPILLALAVAVVVAMLAPPPASGLARVVWLRPAGLTAFLVLVLPWFLFVTASHPGLSRYLLHDEVLGRITTGVHHRHSHWFMGLVIYPPTVLVGALPWSLTWLSAARRAVSRDAWHWLRAEPRRLFLAAWIVTPLLLLGAASSRLPIYALPIFPALALAAGHRTTMRHGVDPDASPRRLAPSPWLCAWIVGLLGLRLLATWYPLPQDTRALARWIAPYVEPGRTEVVVVDERTYGLPFYLDVPVEMIDHRAERPPEYRPTAQRWDEEIHELEQALYRHVFVVPARAVPAFVQRLGLEAATCDQTMGPSGARLFICPPH